MVKLNMANNVIAFAGIDASDYMIYIAGILINLKKKVLLIDHSDTCALKTTIPQPEGVNCSTDIISYRGLDFTTAEINRELLMSYDDILISSGFHKPENDNTFCNRIIFVTDPYRFNHLRLKEYAENCQLQGIEHRELIIKEMIESKITADIIRDNIGICFSTESISVLYREDKDYYNALLCHTNHSFSFHRTTKQLKNYLIRETASLYPDLTVKQIKKACLRAGKGENKNLLCMVLPDKTAEWRNHENSFLVTGSRAVRNDQQHSGNVDYDGIGRKKEDYTYADTL
jgi:hypothetical protein